MRRDESDALHPSRIGHLRRPWPDNWSVEGIVSVLEPLVVEERRARILEVVRQRIGSVTVLLDGLHDPHNGAAIMRSADAFGVQEVHVVPRDESFQVSARVAIGAERWVDVIEHASADEATATLAANGYELLATHPEGELVPRDLCGLERVCLVLGNEHNGIRGELAAAAKRSVRIPMRGFVESLNVSVSAAILLQAATEGRAGDLSLGEQRELYAQGLYRTVTRAEEIVGALASGG